MQSLIFKWKEINILSLRLINIRRYKWNFPRIIENLSTLENENPSLPSKVVTSLLRAEPKQLGKKGENGVSTSLVMSMRPYAHTTLNHFKEGHFNKVCNLHWKALCTFQECIPINKTYSLRQDHEHHNQTRLLLKNTIYVY